MILFLASAGISDQRNGWDPLAPALQQVPMTLPDMYVVIAEPVPDPEAKQAAAQRVTRYSIGKD